jgi:surface polysaccharide O-acyltransferase-like enzyme
MSDKLPEDLLDIKNDRRLSVYLYRAGFGCWLLYIVAGAPLARTLIQPYRTEFGIFAFFLMVMSLSASMIFDYHHQPQAFEQKKKWLIISYLILIGLIYVFILRDAPPSLDNLLPTRLF